MLELYEGKLSRTVLRRGNGGNSVPLAGAEMGKRMQHIGTFLHNEMGVS